MVCRSEKPGGEGIIQGGGGEHQGPRAEKALLLARVCTGWMMPQHLLATPRRATGEQAGEQQLASQRSRWARLPSPGCSPGTGRALYGC